MADLFTDGSCIKLYADDVKLYFEIVNDSNVVTLPQSIDECTKWQLSLSSEKCCHIRLSLCACKNPVNYHINDVALNTVDTVRDLGRPISIDNKLTFVEHINLIVEKHTAGVPTKFYVAFLAEIMKYLLKPS